MLAVAVIFSGLFFAGAAAGLVESTAPGVPGFGPIDFTYSINFTKPSSVTNPLKVGIIGV